MSSPFSKDHQTELSFSGIHAIGWQVGIHSYAWSPPTDVFETDASFVVRLEVAGMRQSDFSIDVEDNFPGHQRCAQRITRAANLSPDGNPLW